MRFNFPIHAAAFLWLSSLGVDGYLSNSRQTSSAAWARRSAVSPLHVSIGLGPDEKGTKDKEEDKPLVAGVDYEIPDHEKYRLSRRSNIDKISDEWYGTLLGSETGILGSVADDTLKILKTPVPLVNDVSETSPYFY